MLFGPRAWRQASSTTVAVVAATLLIAACGSSEYRYVKNSSMRTFFRVPHEWRLFDEDQVLQTSDDSEEAKASFKQSSWSVGFDASPRPSVKNILAGTTHPAGIAQVRYLTEAERHTFSQSSLRSLLLPFDPLSPEAAETGDVEVLGSREVHQDGMHGSEFLLNLKTREGGLIKWRQIALVDSKVRRAHVLAITCSTRCYEQHESDIEKVVSSWTVKES